MKIYLIVEKSYFDDFASFGHLGTWSKVTKKCEKCGFHDQVLIEPLEIEWWATSDKIGDFSWCLYTFIVLSNVRDFMIHSSFECNFGKVEVMKPEEKKRGKKRVKWPYEGPVLHWVKPTARIDLNIEKTGLNPKVCPVCNRIDYGFTMSGIVIDKSAWNKEKVFRINQFGKSAATFVTEESLEEILAQNFTNFHYQEAGIIE